MINILYCSIKSLQDSDVEKYIQVLPAVLRNDIKRCKFIEDQKSKLLARLMLKKSLKDTSSIHLINNWDRNRCNKPFIYGWMEFNISHSGDMVAFAFGNQPVGIDIERNFSLNYTELLCFLHHEEQYYITHSKDKQWAFYEIWVKKEAFLKAIGVGIIQELNNFNCVANYINYQGKNWYWYPFNIHPDFVSYLCVADLKLKLKSNRFLLENG